jgi:hypothetical protein
MLQFVHVHSLYPFKGTVSPVYNRLTVYKLERLLLGHQSPAITKTIALPVSFFRLFKALLRLKQKPSEFSSLIMNEGC